jgi:hypothetical protein
MKVFRIKLRNVAAGVADVDPDPETHVFGPPGSFCHEPKIVRKTLIPTVLWLLNDFLYLKNDVNVASKSNKQKNLGKNKLLVDILRSLAKK